MPVICRHVGRAAWKGFDNNDIYSSQDSVSSPALVIEVDGCHARSGEQESLSTENAKITLDNLLEGQHQALFNNFT